MSFCTDSLKTPAVVIICVVTACATRSPAPDALCEPTPAGALAPGTRAAGLVGTYRLVMVATEGPRAGSSARGDLALTLPPPGVAQPGGAAAPALVGAARIALDSVGAREVGDAASSDPAAPGVLGFERPGESGPGILLRFGSEANRRDQEPFESAYTVLELGAITATGFLGQWRSGLMDTEASGHFCAWQESS